MTYSEQLERETEQTRAAFERTLEELRARITPGQVVDQLVDYARGGTAAAFLRNLGQRTVENPLPLVVIGAGLAWLICANGRATQGEASGPSAGAIAETARSATAAVGDFAQRAKTAIAGDRSEPQLGQTEARRSGVADFFQGHPVMLVGLGLAIGAAIGAAITPPGSGSRADEEAKDRLGHMGEAAQSTSRPSDQDDEAAKARVGHMGEATQTGTTARADDDARRDDTNGRGGAKRQEGTTAL